LKQEKRWYALKWVILTFILFNLCACASMENGSFEKDAAKLHALLQNQTAPSPLPAKPKPQFKKPVLKPIADESVNPLNRRITVAFKELDYHKVFYFLACQCGLNLMLDPELEKAIPPEKQKITFTFKNFTVEEILRKVCELLDVSYKVERGVLWIKPYEEKFFYLDFLPFVKQSNLNIGGDVLGGSSNGGGSNGGSSNEDEVSNPLTGEFRISGFMGRESLDMYAQIKDAIKEMLSSDGKFIINRTVGVLYVKDRPSRIEIIARYIKALKERYTKQVILDVKIIEVSLSRDVNRGIDWLDLSNYLMGTNRVAFNTLGGTVSMENTETPVRITISGNPSIDAILSFLGKYGKVKILSNPRIRVLHAQPALISVGTSIGYIKKIEKETSSESGTTTTSMTVDTSSLFEGILLGITPYITENNQVILQIVPIKSDILELEKAQFEGGSYFVTLPKVNLREMSSIIKTKPGDLVVIGGLILEKKENNEKRVEIPIIDKIFRKKQNYSSKTELVILIRVKVD